MVKRCPVLREHFYDAGRRWHKERTITLRARLLGPCDETKPGDGGRAFEQLTSSVLEPLGLYRVPVVRSTVPYLDWPHQVE